MASSDPMLRSNVRIQSITTGLLLTRKGEWTNGGGRHDYTLEMGAVEAIKLCLRLKIENVRFTAKDSETGAELCAYPFAGNPA